MPITIAVLAAAREALVAKEAEIERLRAALTTIAQTTFSGSEMGDEYQRGNRDAHETCGRMARAALASQQNVGTSK